MLSNRNNYDAQNLRILLERQAIDLSGCIDLLILDRLFIKY